MDTGRFDAWTRRRFGLGVSGLAAGLLGVAAGGGTVAKKKKKKKKDSPPPNPCAGKNWCLDASHTCGDGKRCFVKAFGGNVCGAFPNGAFSCAQCENLGYVCALGSGCEISAGAEFVCVDAG